ncbi:XRE family transcriptional regulator [Actinomadura spongiicola]|uniref:XRE family transcriptional regulator n=1 Tax=Actinomadura spongiicola TaxID=2303421 RepID=A0A372GM02_9ACTN|nr:helix-turn-helix transcriptional regulator [Actinomadura spongiicola]RFS86414.1 XRE family transcriptional regulator [Actinomadura spongiicola]
MTPPKPTYAPSVRARRLARWLRDFRRRSGLSQDAVAARLGWSQGKVGHLESGRNKAAPHDVALMLDIYGVVTPEREMVLELAERAEQRGWWTDYIDVLSSPYVALEDEASTIGDWTPQVVPGLLQTPDYARALLTAWNLDSTSDREIERRLQARMARQTIITRTEAPPSLHVILDESVLARQIGGPEVQRDQMHRLVREARRPNVTIQVLPTSAGAHDGLEGGFILLRFAEPTDPDVAYTEGFHGATYLETPHLVSRCNVAFGRLCELALSPQKSASLIRAAAEQ